MNRGVVIKSRQNSLVKLVRALGSKRTREAEGLFVIEGHKVINEAISSGVSPEKIIVAEQTLEYAAVTEMVRRPGLKSEVVIVSDDVMEYMSETETPPGLLGLIMMPETGLEALNAVKTGPGMLLVIIDGVQDPGNTGTIIRTADAFGVDAVITTGGCADIYNGKVLRAAMGSVFHLPVVRDAEPSDLLTLLREKGISVAATSLGDIAVSLSEARLERPLAVIFGSEARGVSPEFTEAADVLVKIPMPGKAESLNVAVAAGITLYEAFCRGG